MPTSTQAENISVGVRTGVKPSDSQLLSWQKLCPRVVLVVVSVIAAISLVKSLNWPFVHDAPLIQYVVFLMSHDFSPYRDIFEMNMPGTYLIQWLVFHSLGGSAIAWRCFDLLLSAIAMASAVYITRPYDRFAGWIIGGMLIISHLSVGAIDLGQRDYIMAVLLLAAYAFLFAAIRKPRHSMLLIAAVLLTWGAFIKPTAAPFTVLILALGVYVAVKRGQPARKYILSAVLGCTFMTGILAAFLIKEHGLVGFFQMVRDLIPYYATLQHASWKDLLLNFHQANWAVTIIVGLLLLRYCRCWSNWEQWALLLGGLFGVFSFIAQREGLHYHTYPEAFFLFTWIITLCLIAIRTTSRFRYLASAFLLFIAFVIAPWFLRKEFHSHYSMTNLNSMRADLRTLGGQSLDRNVQCLDWAAGCINALYQERIVQTTGAIYDFYLFPVRPDPVLEPYQHKFFRAVTTHPPKFFFLTNSSEASDLGYRRIESWPAFADFLRKNYVLDTDPHLRANSVPGAPYRIYQRIGS